MERARFVGVDDQSWWLLQPELEPTLEEKRKALGASWQWTGDLRWYTDRQKMEEVFQFIEATRPDLLRELDEVQDVARREQWLDNLIGTKSPPVEAATQEAPPVAQKPATAVTAPAGTPRKASAFGRRESDQDRESGAPGEAPASPGASATAPPTEARRASPFAKKAAPVTEPAAPEPAASTGAAPAADEEHLQQISEQVQTVMADLSPNELSAIAGDLGLTAEQVETMVQNPNSLAWSPKNRRASGRKPRRSPPARRGPSEGRRGGAGHLKVPAGCPGSRPGCLHAGTRCLRWASDHRKPVRWS